MTKLNFTLITLLKPGLTNFLRYNSCAAPHSLYSALPKSPLRALWPVFLSDIQMNRPLSAAIIKLVSHLHGDSRTWRWRARSLPFTSSCCLFPALLLPGTEALNLSGGGSCFPALFQREIDALTTGCQDSSEEASMLCLVPLNNSWVLLPSCGG